MRSQIYSIHQLPSLVLWLCDYSMNIIRKTVLQLVVVSIAVQVNLLQLKQDKPIYKKGCTDKAANQTG